MFVDYDFCFTAVQYADRVRLIIPHSPCQCQSGFDQFHRFVTKSRLGEPHML